MRLFSFNNRGAAQVAAPAQVLLPGNRGKAIGSYKSNKYWEDQGWKYSGYELNGYYRTYYGAFRGRIQLSNSGLHRYYIFSPPPQLKKHPHWACFVYKGDDMYWVHFSTEPKNVDTGIVTIETIIREALERKD